MSSSPQIWNAWCFSKRKTNEQTNNALPEWLADEDSLQQLGSELQLLIWFPLTTVLFGKGLADALCCFPCCISASDTIYKNSETQLPF